MTQTTEPTSAPHLPRRAFLRYAGATSAATALLLAGCKDDTDTTNNNTTPDPNAATVSLGTNNSIATLNLMQAIKQVTAELYKRITAAPPTGLSTAEADLLRTMLAHETTHRDFLKAAANSYRIQASDAKLALADLTFDFSKVTITDRNGALTALLKLENLAVRTMVGFMRYLTSESLVTTFSQMLSVDARHAATLADLLGASASVFDPQDTLPDARNYSQLPAVSIPLLNEYLATGSKLLVGVLA